MFKLPDARATAKAEVHNTTIDKQRYHFDIWQSTSYTARKTLLGLEIDTISTPALTTSRPEFYLYPAEGSIIAHNNITRLDWNWYYTSPRCHELALPKLHPMIAQLIHDPR